jgi:hypothetical protein
MFRVPGASQDRCGADSVPAPFSKFACCFLQRTGTGTIITQSTLMQHFEQSIANSHHTGGLSQFATFVGSRQMRQIKFALF